MEPETANSRESASSANTDDAIYRAYLIGWLVSTKLIGLDVYEWPHAFSSISTPELAALCVGVTGCSPRTQADVITIVRPSIANE